MATVVDEGILEMSILKFGFKARLGPFPASWFGHLPPPISVSDIGNKESNISRAGDSKEGCAQIQRSSYQLTV